MPKLFIGIAHIKEQVCSPDAFRMLAKGLKMTIRQNCRHVGGQGRQQDWRRSTTLALSIHTVRTFFLCALGCALFGAPLHSLQFPVPGGSDRPRIEGRRISAFADTAVLRALEIPAQALTDALTAFSRQTDLVVKVNLTSLKGLRSAAVSGTLNPRDGLSRLLALTGLTFHFVDARTAVVSAPGQHDQTAQQLQLVSVTGISERQPGYGQRRSAATKSETTLRDSPQSVSVVTGQLIADQAMQSMADVVRYVPGITMSLGEGHRDQPIIRGNNSSADFFADGLRDDAQYLRDVYNVDRVEALKGANAMLFGRGGGGGVVNRVLKEARWQQTRTLILEGGSFDHKRATVDVGGPLSARMAARTTAMAERSGGFREAARLERYGVNPTVAIVAGAQTSVRLGYEYFRDDRQVDRGIPSFEGRPVPSRAETFFGNPAANGARASNHVIGATVEHETSGGVTLRNRTRFADYDKFYQNSFPSAVSSDGTRATLSAYRDAVRRQNLLNQTELRYHLGSGRVSQTLLVGVEVGHQRTAQLRSTGYFADGSTSGVTTLSVPVTAPSVSTAVSFRQNATDAAGRTTVATVSGYLQDQIMLSSRWSAIFGLRAERFAVRYHNNRNGQELARTDALFSPRAGLVYKPATPVSLYSSYGVSYLPSSGDQFTALSVTSQALGPEQFRNIEFGAKWDIRSDLAVTAAAYRLDRTNTAAPDPTNPARVVQTGAQRTTGYEVGVAGDVTKAWQVAGGFVAQRAILTSRTTAAPAGASVPLAPQRTASLWNRFQLTRPLGVGLGIVHQGAMYAAIDNRVKLPMFTRVDGAAFVTLSRVLGAQINIENVLGRRYFGSAYNNSNIMPGAPRTIRISLKMGATP